MKKYKESTAVSADGTAIKKSYKLNKKQFFKFSLFFFGAIILAGIVYVSVVIVKAPSIDTGDIYKVLTESTVIYDDKGNEVDTVFTESNRSNVAYKDLPGNLVNAFVALEDKTFWKHHGFNFIRILGAIKESIFGGGSVSGTSTITQQLARNLFLKDSRFDHSLNRKIVEAYYTVLLEKDLSKNQIIEAYLNTIDFGYYSSGVQAASQAYFSKDVQKLTLSQCSALAALPQAPSDYQLVEVVSNDSVTNSTKNILKRTSQGTYIANDVSKSRRDTCLSLMLEQELISKEQYDKASAVTLRKMLKPSYNSNSGKASYFADYVIDEVIEDLMEKKEMNYDTAWEQIYQGGLKIYSTMDSQAQNVIETEFDNDSNFPVALTNTDGAGNIVNKYGVVMLWDYDDLFDSNGDFTFMKNEIIKNNDGSMVIKANKRLNIYQTEVNGEADYSVEFKDMYIKENGTLYAISGGFINIPQNFKSLNKNGNLVISSEFFTEYPLFFVMNGNGTVTIPSSSYTLEQKVIQPQAAMTIVDNATGQIKAMVGGRKTTGRMLHNRAISPRQPGSSIKPLGVYAAAIQQSANEAASGQSHNFIDYDIDKQGAKFWGHYLTAGSTVMDEKTLINGKVWPENAGGGYTGYQSMRTALQQSINTCAVKIFLQVGETFSADLVKKFGITTVDTEGDVNDLNPAALALGGMTEGVTTLEMASAYTAFPNNGTRKETSSYSKVVDSKGNTILNSTSSQFHKVLDPGVAWIMADMLKSVVYAGIGGPASISGVQVGGKTGTTSDQYDIWFDGFTPSYSAALWIGNDVNIELSTMSGTAASLWGRIMNQINGAKAGSYQGAPSNVSNIGGEYYVTGTHGGAAKPNDQKKSVIICTETGYLATPDCTSTKKKTFDTYSDDEADIPKYYCYKHNSDVTKYPISPNETWQEPDPVVPPKDPDGPEDPDKPVDPNPPVPPNKPARTAA